MTRRKIFRYLLLAVLIFGIVTGFSLTRYVLAHPNDPLQQNVASWARNKGMGVVVDKLESWLHNDPPAVAPTDTFGAINRRLHHRATDRNDITCTSWRGNNDHSLRKNDASS